MHVTKTVQFDWSVVFSGTSMLHQLHQISLARN